MNSLLGQSRAGTPIAVSRNALIAMVVGACAVALVALFQIFWPSLEPFGKKANGVYAAHVPVEPIPHSSWGYYGFTDNVSLSGDPPVTNAGNNKLIFQMVSPTAAEKFDVSTVRYLDMMPDSDPKTAAAYIQARPPMTPQISEVRGSQVELYFPEVTGYVVIQYPASQEGGFLVYFD